MVKMELMHSRPSGHARSDPILSQTCASGHVHSFYGPMEFHPETTYEDLVGADPGLSTSNVVENQSLYWHPTVYQVSGGSVDPVYNRVPTSLTTYYRWDHSALPRTEEFPPGFRVIASSADRGAPPWNMFSECCNYPGGVQDCQTVTGAELSEPELRPSGHCLGDTDLLGRNRAGGHKRPPKSYGVHHRRERGWCLPPRLQSPRPAGPSSSSPFANTRVPLASTSSATAALNTTSTSSTAGRRGSFKKSSTSANSTRTRR